MTRGFATGVHQNKPAVRAETTITGSIPVSTHELVLQKTLAPRATQWGKESSSKTEWSRCEEPPDEGQPEQTQARADSTSPLKKQKKKQTGVWSARWESSLPISAFGPSVLAYTTSTTVLLPAVQLARIVCKAHTRRGHTRKPMYRFWNISVSRRLRPEAGFQRSALFSLVVLIRLREERVFPSHRKKKKATQTVHFICSTVCA